ncbi:hypothetical protein HPP92_011660 [Vanilla planifolia]|uniref:Uncharacterized protein n=1 Tax=Vanilla planifolia TaxID=51239 RepID=A0A835R128_VANPL|nr:hypothetical protein HPP92_011973 [Vanilla planifolia]KAG0483576.1 hypothetical protein HPP92_011660 [Vanilla planifolia]
MWIKGNEERSYHPAGHRNTATFMIWRSLRQELFGIIKVGAQDKTVARVRAKGARQCRPLNRDAGQKPTRGPRHN